MTTILPAVKPRYSRRFQVRRLSWRAVFPKRPIPRRTVRYRDIRENAIGVIGNECVVRVLRDGADEAGRPWAFVATLDGHPVGWIYRELISYN